MVSPPAKTITSLIPLSQEMLEQFLTASSCDKDVISHVERRAHIILQAIFPDEREEDLLRYKSLRLYYIVLEVVCRGEGAETLYAILTDERFHRCMLACAASVEILLITVSSTGTELFPAQVLERSGITAFDLNNTVIGSFIRHEESFPGQFRRRLNSFKEQLLESMVWKKGSSLYNSLAVARPSLSAEINRLGLFAEPMPSVDEIATHINSSCGGGLPPVPSLPKLELETSPSKGGGGETCAETEINNFFSEIIMLGAVRINGMVEKLQLSQQIGEKVYCLFQRILNQLSFLFFDFHIDQIILCCFHGVAKDLTFGEIIHSYRMQPHYEPPVFHSEFVNWPLAYRPYEKRIGQAHVEDIVKFYTDIFIPEVKPLLSELGTGGTTVKSDQIAEFNNENDGQSPGSPKILPFPSLSVMSPEEVSATHYVCVSPLGSSEIIMLGAVRINSMVEMLQLSQQMRENVYRLFQRILHQQTSLFFNRHIDQIILCCFCGVAKISKLNLTFGEILNSYKKQPQCKPRVFDSVFVDWSLACQDWASNKTTGQEHVDIVTFYNDIFFPSVKPLLLELGAGGATVKSDRKLSYLFI